MVKRWFCPKCEGYGEVPRAYMGRIYSNDPADWDNVECPECNGFGHVDYEPVQNARPWSPSKRRWHRRETATFTDPLLVMMAVRGKPGWGCMGPHVTYDLARERAMKPVTLPDTNNAA